MEKYSTWRDSATGIQPFLLPLPTQSNQLPLILKSILYPLSYTLSFIRTLLFLLVLSLHYLLVEVLLKVCLVIPPLYDVLSRIITTLLLRFALFLLGYWWINVENVVLKRTIRGPIPPPFSPQRGDLIVANSSSYVELLYLAFRYNATFLLPVSSTGSKSSSTTSAKITSFRRVSLWKMIRNTGFGPERSERGESLDSACRNSRTPAVIFPECTTSNNRACLKFGVFQSEPNTSKTSNVGSTTASTTYIISFKHDLPTSTTPSATHPIPSSSYNPLPHIFNLNTSPSARTLVVKKLNPLESPKVSLRGSSTSTTTSEKEWEIVSDCLSATGRWKKVGLDWESKGEFLKFRAKKER